MLRKLFASAFIVSATIACAQSPAAGHMSPPKVLVIDREYLKPGKSGTLHEKTESAFVRASAAAKWPQTYLAMDSLTGPYRSLFFFGYDSYDAWQSDSDAQARNVALSATMDRASAADGDLLSSSDVSVWNFRPDLSLNTNVSIPLMRYMEIIAFKVKPGRSKEFEELVRLYQSGYEKNVPDSHWAVYSNQFGTGEGGVYLAIFPHKSLSEFDKGFNDGKTVMAAMGAEGQKHAAELDAACVDSSQANLFHFNPRMSYMNDASIAMDPDFWKPKPSATPKAAAKPQ